MIIYHLFISFHVAYIYYHLTMLTFALFMLRMIVYKELTLTNLQRQYCYFYSNGRQTYFKQAVKNWRNVNASKYCRYLSHMIVIKNRDILWKCSLQDVNTILSQHTWHVRFNIGSNLAIVYIKSMRYLLLSIIL